MERRWLTVREAAEYLGLSVKGAHDMASAGKLPAARIGRLVRIDRQRLEADLERQTQGGPAGILPKGRRLK